MNCLLNTGKKSRNVRKSGAIVEICDLLPAVPDDGRLFEIGIVWHLTYPIEDEAEALLDVEHEMVEVNKNFNMMPDNFDSGKDVYTDPSFIETYNDYVSRAGSANIDFIVHEVEC